MKPCSQCGAPAKAKGLCPKHYQQQRREDPVVLADFAARGRAYRADPVKGPARRERHRQYIRNYSRGWTPEFERLAREAQCGLCAICARPMTKGRAHDGECADHFDLEGVATPRALLCSTCNKSLGGYELRQRPAGLRIAPYEEYLARYDVRYGSRTDNPG